MRNTSRLLLEEGLKNTKPAKLKDVIEYWSKLLPNISVHEHSKTPKKEEHRKMHRAVIILGIIISMGLVEADDSAIISRVSQELLGLLYAEEGRDMFRMAAMELLGTGISYWKDHIHVGSLFRLILSWGFALSPIRNSSKTSHSQFSFNIIAKTFGQILSWDIQNDRAKVLEEFCKEIVSSPSTLDKIVSMELLHVTITSNSEERERLKPTLIPLLHSIVTNFKDKVAFEQETQHIATASLNNVIVYDLKASNKIASYKTENETIIKISLHRNNLGAVVRKNNSETPTFLLINWMMTGSGGFLFFKSKPQIIFSQPFKFEDNIESSKLFFKDRQLILVNNQNDQVIQALAF
jgi:hypothetical protein